MAEYLAPGVYVEEVPSAQQPITGVGTNTVGFIGVVPDEILFPVPNPDYDPVIAKMAAGLVEGTVPAGDLDLDQDIENKKAELVRANERRAKADGDAAGIRKEHDDALKNVQDMSKSLESMAPDDAGRNDLAKNLKDQQRRLDDSTKRLATAQKAQADAQADVEKLEDQIGELQDVIDKKVTAPSKPNHGSVIRPYLLAKFGKDDGMADPCDTKLCTNFTEYTKRFGYFSADELEPDPNDPKKTVSKFLGHRNLTHAVNGFFRNGGTRCFVARVRPDNVTDIDRALSAFESIDEIAIIAAPGLDAFPDIWDRLITHCEICENRFAILDCPPDVEDQDGDLDIEALTYDNPDNVLPGRDRNAAYYFPYIEVVDPSKALQDADPARDVAPKYRGRVYIPPSGHVAGIYARSDVQRGVHKAPANAPVLGALDVKYYVGKPKQTLLNPQGVNCIRNMNGNITVWGARTIGGDRNGEWKYINVRRVFLYLRKSIDQGTQWIVFEPNDQTLWAKIRLNVSDFLRNVWRSGALFGATPEEAYYVKCDAELNPPEVRDQGQVITEIGVAIVRPAEFVIFRITQSTGIKAS